MSARAGVSYQGTGYAVISTGWTVQSNRPAYVPLRFGRSRRLIAASKALRVRRQSHHRMSRPLADRDRVLAAFSLRRRIGGDDGSMERLPILGRELPQVLHREVLQEFVRVHVLSDRLHL